MSIQNRRGFLNDPRRAERCAVRALAGVGGAVEWWVWRQNEATGVGWVGHLRVPITAAEAAQVPEGVVEMDAGETGPIRPRTIHPA